MAEVRKFRSEVNTKMLVGDPNFRLPKWQQSLGLINIRELKEAIIWPWSHVRSLLPRSFTQVSQKMCPVRPHPSPLRDYSLLQAARLISIFLFLFLIKRKAFQAFTYLFWCKVYRMFYLLIVLLPLRRFHTLSVIQNSLLLHRFPCNAVIFLYFLLPFLL